MTIYQKQKLNSGSIDDKVTLVVNGKDIEICESYEIKIAVMTQPAAFSLRLGHGGVASELIKLCPKGASFQLKINGIQIQTGTVDGVAVPSSDATVIEINGRDSMRALVNGHVEEDVNFNERTYYQLTRKVLDIVGLKNCKLIAGNGANRQAVTATKVPIPPTEAQLAQMTETGIAPSNGSKVVFQTLRAKVGQRWYDWLQERYKLAGLFLWSAGDGSFILSTLEPKLSPAYVLSRQRGVDRNVVNIVTHSWKDDATGRHAKYIVYGRQGAGKGGRHRFKGEYVDEEMVAAGFSDVITYHENGVSSIKEAEYLARRYAAEERRGGWELSYTVAGHTTPSLINGQPAIWMPDNTVQVYDDELAIKGNHYIESVTYSRKPQTATRIDLIRPSDLVYLATSA